MAEPDKGPRVGISRRYPSLWRGEQPGFRLVKTLVTPIEKWRIYAIAPGARNARDATGGDG
jgi:hypothetical protein